MIEGIEPLYQQIADAMQSAIPEPWESASVEVVFFSENSTYTGEYSAEGDVHPKSFSAGLKIVRPFRALRELFRNAGKPLWCRARFELHADGSFKMDWGYDDCDENGFAHFDEKKESERLRQIRMRQGLSS